MIHPEVAKVLATLPEADGSPLDPEVMRAEEAARVAPIEERPQVQAVEDMTVVTLFGDVPVRIYTPDQEPSYGLLVYFHGGAFFLGSLETHDHVARSLALGTGYKVISVGYRLAPEDKYPAGLQDCYGVVRWAADHGEYLKWNGVDLAIAGDSSGGTYVAAVAAMAHDDGFDRISGQVMFYPSLDLDFDIDRYPSLQENAEGYGVETATLKAFNSFYVDSGADPADPLVSPIKRQNLAGLPPALIVTAEHDPLRDEGELYGRRLQEAGVDATVRRYEGANHGFVQFFSWIPEFSGVFAETGEFLNRDAR